MAIRVVEDEDWRMVYYVADVWMRNIADFRTAFGHGKFNSGTEDAETFATREHAVFAVNGTYNKGILFHNGEFVRKAPAEDNEIRRGIMVLYLSLIHI